MLQAKDLTKRYGGLLALERVNFHVAPGEIVGYLGPNGSGKSTTVNLVVGLLEPSEGHITLNGMAVDEHPVEYKRQVGYVPEEPFLYTHLTAGEYLTLVGRLRNIRPDLLEHRIAGLQNLLQLHDSRYKTMRAFSKGMRQRVLLAAALLHNPSLLVLDEPFSGLDVNAGLLFQALLSLLASEGRMILFSTHRFDMVEKLCSRVVMLSAGRIVAEERVADFARGGRQSLEDVFVRVTSQPDYHPVAQQILDTIATMNAGHDTPFQLLTRHFFGALFDLGFLSESQTSSLAQLIAGIAGALLAAGFILARVMMYRYGALSDLPNALLYEQTVLTDHVFLIAVPMWIVAFVAVLVGPSLLPDETDFRVLGAMPVTRPVVFGAKLAALVLFIGLFVAASEAALLPMFTVTTISPHREHAYVALLAAYLVAGALGALFAALSVTAVQALLLLLVPRRVLLTVSAATGSLMLFALVVGVPLVGHVPSFAQAFSSGSRWLLVFPPAWFVGLEQWLVGESRYGALAIAALGALIVAGFIAGASYLVLYRHFDRVMIRPARGDAPPVNLRRSRTRGVLRRPGFTAVWTFTWLTLRRSALHQGVLVAVAALGVAVVVSHVLGLDFRAAFTTTDWRRRELIGALTWAPFVLMFAIALAVRAALLVPIDSRANWIFRLTEQPGTRPQQMDAAASTMVCLGVLAPCALLAPVQWILAGPVSLMSAAVAALCGLVLVEILLLDWRRVPFTCSYLLGKGSVPLTLIKSVFAFVFFTNIGAALARVSRTSPGSAGVIVIGLLLASVVALRRLRRHLRTEEPLEYEDTLPSEMNPLRLSPD